MFKNYITTAIRNLLRHKLFSIINIGGLAVGLAAVMLIALFVKDELSYDAWLTDVGHLYRVETTYNNPGGDTAHYDNSSGLFKAAFLNDFSHLADEVTRLRTEGRVVQNGDEYFREIGAYVDGNFFSVIDLPVVSGSREATLDDNAALMINERMAEKYFGANNPVGETLVLNDIAYRIVAVMKDLPKNTHLDFSFVALLDENRYAQNQNALGSWANPGVVTYIKLKPDTDAAALEQQFPAFIDKHFATVNPNSALIGSEFIEYTLMPIEDIHLYFEGINFTQPEGGSITTVYIFSLIAGLILLIASINFVNLATARSLKRAREVSLRKVLGAQRKQLMQQFLGESLMTTAFALVLALALVELVLPWYNGFLGKALSLSLIGDLDILLLLGFLVAGVGIIGGLYPAFVLSGFRPVKILSANQSGSDGSPVLRTFLVALQFSISIALITATIIIYSQNRYARTIDLGYEKNHSIALSSGAAPISETLKNELLAMEEVVAATRSSDYLPRKGVFNTAYILSGERTGDQIMSETMVIDVDFFEFLGVEPVGGRLFSRDFPADAFNGPADTDTGGEFAFSVILNETAVRKFGFRDAESAIGMSVSFPSDDPNFTFPGTVVGVVPDMLIRSVREELSSVVFLYFEGNLSVLNLQLETADMQGAIARIQQVWNQHMPGLPMSYQLMEDGFDTLYRVEDKQAELLLYFSIFAIFVASLGLFGLASFAAQTRTKEIGVRKVLGARVLNIIHLLTWQFSKPVLIANLIAWPIGWYFMSDWLAGFAYRIDLSPLYFVASGVMALFIAWATVGGHAYRVARTSPIHALRYE